MYRVNEECPADNTNRSRPTHLGSAGSCRITFWNKLYASGANDIAVPGCPLPTFCTASAANTRAVSTARRSNSDQSTGTWAVVSSEISSVVVTDGDLPGAGDRSSNTLRCDRGTCLNWGMHQQMVQLKTSTGGVTG